MDRMIKGVRFINGVRTHLMGALVRQEFRVSVDMANCILSPMILLITLKKLLESLSLAELMKQLI